MNIDWLGGFITGVATMFVMFVLALYNSDEGPGYKQGQVDALNGKVKYVLIENDDKTKVWIRDDSTRKD